MGFVGSAKACKGSSQWRVALALMNHAEQSSLALDGFACSAAAVLRCGAETC